MDIFPTIAAVSTPPGKGGVAMIRVSGADAAAVAQAIFRPFSGKALTELGARRAVAGRIVRADGAVVDTGVAVLYRGPASFTGEDVAEITCHGGVAVTRAVLAAALEAGAVPAGRGEFTRRAFLSGKLTLSEAEAVGLLIDADTESRRALAASAAEGRLTAALAPITASLTDVLSALYAAIDYPEEDVGDEGERAFRGVMAEALSRVEALRATYRCGRAIAEGIPTVIAGVPNSGKSSLYNALLGRDEAIVTEIPGTTRDVLSAAADVGGVTLLLSDTAGIRESADAVERLGVARAREKLAEAALILFVVDSSAPLTPACAALWEALPPDVARIPIFNKCDAPRALSAADAARFGAGAVWLSARTGEGMDELREAVARAAGTDALDAAHDAVIWDARQEALLARAASLLSCAIEALDAQDPLDAVCTMCESALAELSGLDGRGVDETIIEGIFARFCVGK